MKLFLKSYVKPRQILKLAAITQLYIELNEKP